MSKCVHCHERKGKRPCPALGGLICSQCCGEHRVVHITCPADCAYLDSSYKELFEVGGEKAAGFFNLIEVVTFSYFLTRRDGQDADVLAAIQSLRRTLSPIHVPPAPESVFAERLKKEYETFKKQESERVLDSQTATDILDRALKFVTEFSGGSIQSQRFLNGLIGYIKTHHPAIAEHLAKQQEGSRIVLPGQLTPTPGEPGPHLHTHGQPHSHPHHH